MADLFPYPLSDVSSLHPVSNIGGMWSPASFLGCQHRDIFLFWTQEQEANQTFRDLNPQACLKMKAQVREGLVSLVCGDMEQSAQVWSWGTS